MAIHRFLANSVDPDQLASELIWIWTLFVPVIRVIRVNTVLFKPVCSCDSFVLGLKFAQTDLEAYRWLCG